MAFIYFRDLKWHQKVWVVFKKLENLFSHLFTCSKFKNIDIDLSNGS